MGTRGTEKKRIQDGFNVLLSDFPFLFLSIKKGEENEALSISNINIETKDKKNQEEILDDRQKNYNENTIEVVTNNAANATYNEENLQNRRKSKRGDIIDDGDLGNELKSLQ